MTKEQSKADEFVISRSQSAPNSGYIFYVREESVERSRDLILLTVCLSVCKYRSTAQGTQK